MIPPARRAAALRSACRSLRFESLETRQVLSGSGLTAQYFHNENLTGLAFERVEQPNFVWGTTPPAPGVDPTAFSARWFGRVEATSTDTYTFHTVSDDGVRVWVDGQLLIDDWNVQGSRLESGAIALQAGQQYDIQVEYFNVAGNSTFRLQWSSPSQTRQNIPASQLYASPSGLLGAYADSSGNVIERVDQTIDFDWGTGTPIVGIPADGFGVTWTGFVRPDFSDAYQFRITSDERVRLWIGNELLIDNWTPHPVAVDLGAKQLEAGKWYEIRIEYGDVTGQAEIELAWQSDRQTNGAFEAVAADHLSAAKPAQLTATNPLGPGQDPFVIQWEGQYLHVRSAGNGVWIDRAEHLEDIHPSDPASVSKKVWTAPAGTNYSGQIWAPELHHINGKWYIYVTASDGVNNSTHRMHVLERDAADPFGAFVYKGQLAATTDRFAIDGTVLQWADKLYFIWSGWPGTVDGQQNLYIAEMSNAWTISGERAVLSVPTYNWERFGLPINEGPQVLIHEGKLHIIYSGSGYWRDEYALGRITYNGVGPIMSASSWVKSPTPVFKQAGDIVGTGHASFVKSPDGTEDWIVYHAHHDPNNWQDDRDILIQQFTFNADGTPNFGTPIPKTTPVVVPSGYVDPERPFVAGDFDASGITNAADLAVFKGSFGQTITPGISADADGNGIVDGADFLYWQRNYGAQATATVAVASTASTVPASSAASTPAAIIAETPTFTPPNPAPHTARLSGDELIDSAFAANAYGPALSLQTLESKNSTPQANVEESIRQRGDSAVHASHSIEPNPTDDKRRRHAHHAPASPEQNAEAPDAPPEPADSLHFPDLWSASES
ncbi:alpha-L-arabinofuranosidase II [Lacipirellula parvula]|uniref:Alpha-L-arabinofuranosidase II n=2 Tax=Lacipirellula parvula TaxID=2650471 RepID=A0A5K7XMB7_9BACT|nr:alpha-L-arabinofuranosidase II [Lacipirellula parvula]